MPPVSAPEASAVATDVWCDWRTLTLNPYVALSAALPLLDAPGVKHGGVLGDLAAECVRVRERWEGSSNPWGVRAEDGGVGRRRRDWQWSVA